MLSTGLAEAREAIQQEIKARNQLQRHVGFVKTPPIPESLQKDILEDTTQALNILKQDKTGIEKAQQEVQSLRHITRLSQNPSIRRTEQELVGVMAKAGMAHKEALGITHKLLQAWDSTRSSASVESLRVGLSRSKKR